MKTLSDNIFLRVHKGKWILWDFKNNKQYLLTKNEFSQLYSLTSDKPSRKKTKFYKELIKNKLLTNKINKTWGWDDLSYIFHTGTMDVQSPKKVKDKEDFLKKYFNHSEVSNELHTSIEDFEYNGKVSNLPKPIIKNNNKNDLFKVLFSRRTVRDFVKKPISKQKLSNLLNYSFGYAHGIDKQLNVNEVTHNKFRKFFPSPGNLHSEEIFVQINNVKGQKKGIYHYNPTINTLTKVNNRYTESELTKILLGQYYTKNAAIVIFMTTRFDKIWTKYKHSRAYRMALVANGSCLQNFQLISKYYKLDSWVSGHFHDTSISQKLKLPDGCYPCLVLAAGYSTGKSLPRELQT